MHHVNKSDVEMGQRMEVKNVMNEVIMEKQTQHVQAHVQKLVYHAEVKINEQHIFQVSKRHHG